MDIRVEMESGQFVVYVDEIELEASFDEADDATTFIQSLVENVTS